MKKCKDHGKILFGVKGSCPICGKIVAKNDPITEELIFSILEDLAKIEDKDVMDFLEETALDEVEPFSLAKFLNLFLKRLKTDGKDIIYVSESFKELYRIKGVAGA